MYDCRNLLEKKPTIYFSFKSFFVHFTCSIIPAKTDLLFYCDLVRHIKLLACFSVSNRCLVVFCARLDILCSPRLRSLKATALCTLWSTSFFCKETSSETILTYNLKTVHDFVGARFRKNASLSQVLKCEIRYYTKDTPLSLL